MGFAGLPVAASLYGNPRRDMSCKGLNGPCGPVGPVSPCGPVLILDEFGYVPVDRDAPALHVAVHGADFDYPDVVARLKDLVDRAAYYNFVD